MMGLSSMAVISLFYLNSLMYFITELGLAVFITFRRYAFYGSLLLEKSGIKIVRVSSVFTSFQRALLHISRYLGTSLTQRTSLSFNSFFFPHKISFANLVVISRLVGQYLRRSKFKKVNYLLH